MAFTPKTYDVLVIGAGHAGCEAALAAARMGCRVLLLAIDLDKLAAMPCSPSIGGMAKGQLVKEIDALGGEMAKITDRTAIPRVDSPHEAGRVQRSTEGPAPRTARCYATATSTNISIVGVALSSGSVGSVIPVLLQMHSPFAR
jgi:glucose-inhibited division protein A